MLYKKIWGTIISLNISFGLVSSLTQAATDTSPQCPTSQYALIDSDAVTGQRDQASVDITANYAEIVDNTLTLQGQVEVIRGDQKLKSNQAQYNPQQRKITAEGQVHYQDVDFEIEAASIEWLPDQQKGELSQTRYHLPRHNHARGQAQHVTMNGRDNTQLTQATYTTCPATNNSWLLSAKDLHIDQKNAIGIARHATLRFKGVPFLYLPYLHFPLDDRRRSGWLMPTFSTTEETGFDVRVPYYMNIAPDQDATLTPRLLTRRGLMLGAEYRYLTATGNGKMALELLPDDSLFGDDRGQFSFRHFSRLAPRWSIDLNVNYASDSAYFEDFGDSLSVSSITHLERRISTRWNGQFWNASAMLQSYQTIDASLSNSQRPYKRLPRLLFNYEKPGSWGLVYGLRSEWTYFDRDDSTTGSRLDVLPRVQWPLRTAATFITPAVSLRYTQYDLNDTAFEATPDRAIPLLSVDSGLFLERHINWRGKRLLQTLEPRLFYLYVPKKQQDQLPIFDAGELDFSFTQLFQENRFVGADRVGDANQLTMALSSRLLTTRDGSERLRASIGQIWYFQDREVTLPNKAVEDSKTSAVVAEVHTNLIDQWSARSTFQWDPDTNKVDKSVVQLHYQSDEDHIFNLAYRVRDTELEQTDVSWIWPLNQKWDMVGRWNYSLHDHRTLETFAGFEYDSCCWSTRIVLRDHINDDKGNHNLSIYFELALKGFSKIGNKVDHLLETSILGYQR